MVPRNMYHTVLFYAIVNNILVFNMDSFCAIFAKHVLVTSFIMEYITIRKRRWDKCIVLAELEHATLDVDVDIIKPSNNGGIYTLD